MKPEQIKKWRKEHPDLEINDEVLVSIQDCASLYGNDYLVYLEGKAEATGDDTLRQAAAFLRSLMREVVWCYGMWGKMQRDANPSKLMGDLLVNATGAGYEFVRKFLIDYMKANNIADPQVKTEGFDFDKLPSVSSVTKGSVEQG